MKVHSFESMAALDGDGIRYCIFLSGCPLRCVYCHNPDTQRGGGREYTPEEIVARARRYKVYFKNGGGVTFSGGEPLLQSAEIEKCIPLLKEEGIGYALDTSLAVPLTESVKNTLLSSDLIIADLKFATAEDMERYTGGDLSLVTDNLRFIHESGKRCWVRTVVVPGINDSVEALTEYKKLLYSIITPEKWELLPFHTMGFDKYEALGLDNPLKDVKPMDIDKLRELEKAVKSDLQ